MKKVKKVYVPYSNNDDIEVVYEIPFKKEVIVPGTKILIKHQRGIFVFHHLAINHKLGVQWIDCRNAESFEYRSFYLDRLKDVYRIKKRRRKKSVGT